MYLTVSIFRRRNSFRLELMTLTLPLKRQGTKTQMCIMMLRNMHFFTYEFFSLQKNVVVYVIK